MSCQEVLSMLSAYIDGEVQTSDAEMIETHLSECDSCAEECNALQSMTGMLRTTPEVEPPAFLLAQIEAATVKRAGFLARVQRAFDQVPTSLRWASAPAAAAAILIAILLSTNAPTPTTVAGKSPTERVERVLPGEPNVAATEQTSARDAVVATLPVTKAWTRSRPDGKSLGAPQNSHRKAVTPGELKPADSGETSTPAEPRLEEPIVDQPVIASSELDRSETAIAPATVGTDEPVVVAKASDAGGAKKPVVLDEQPSGMDQLRAKLAARNRARLNGQEDRIAGRKYSVGLISLRF